MSFNLLLLSLALLMLATSAFGAEPCKPDCKCRGTDAKNPCGVGGSDCGPGKDDSVACCYYYELGVAPMVTQHCSADKPANTSMAKMIQPRCVCVSGSSILQLPCAECADNASKGCTKCNSGWYADAPLCDEQLVRCDAKF